MTKTDKTNKTKQLSRGDYVFFPGAIRAGVYKVIEGKKHGSSKRFKGLWLYRNDSIVPLNEDLDIQVIQQDFTKRWLEDWVDVESVLNVDRESGDVFIEPEVLVEGSDYSGGSEWFGNDASIFPHEELRG